jgi:hypothetical protein
VLTLADVQSDEYRKVDIAGNPADEISRGAEGYLICWPLHKPRIV